jgi:DNA repair exonuclease SbcCD nuclease subunit
MVIGFISDLHIKIYKKNNNFLKHIIKSIDDFYGICIERKVDYVFILGDVFHLKDTVAIEAQHEALISLRKIMNKFPTYMIPGNHDILSKGDAKINGLSIFSSSCNFFDDYGFFDSSDFRFHFLPYFNDEVIINKLKEVSYDKDKKNILCTHLGLKGFNLDNGHEDVYSELDINSLGNDFYKVFSGHYHSFQNKGSMTYVSSPYESHFGDEGDHGWTFYNTDKDEIEFVPNLNSPKFISVELKNSNMDYINSLSNSFIKLIIRKNLDSSLLIKYREKLLNNNFDVFFEWDLSKSNQKIAVAKDWETIVSSNPEDILKSYINDNNFDLDKKELLGYLEL